MVETSHEKGFAKPSKRERRTRRWCSSSPTARGGAAREVECGSPRDLGVAQHMEEEGCG